MTGWKNGSFQSLTAGEMKPSRWNIEAGWIRMTVARIGDKYTMEFHQYTQLAKGLSAEDEAGAKSEALEDLRTECMQVIQEIDATIMESRYGEGE